MTLVFKSIMVYDPNRAECPGESHRPSPPKTTSLSSARRDAMIHAWWPAHTLLTAGNRKALCCRQKVLVEMVATCMWLNTLSTLLGMAPAARMAVDRDMFPAGVRPTYGWLFHCVLNWQARQMKYTSSNVPLVVDVMMLSISAHRLHGISLSRGSRHAQKIMNLSASPCSVSVGGSSQLLELEEEDGAYSSSLSSSMGLSLSSSESTAGMLLFVWVEVVTPAEPVCVAASEVQVQAWTPAGYIIKLYFQFLNIQLH